MKISDRDTQNVREREFTVDQNFDGWRLDQFLANRIGRMSRSRAGDVAKYGDISVVPPRKVKAGTRLRQGDIIIIREHLPAEEINDAGVVVLFEDEALVILSKPAGMLVHEAGNVRLHTVAGYLERHGYEGAEAVHRIDRETSGIMVCARRPDFVPGLRARFASDHPQKTYRALAVDPLTRWPSGCTETLDTPLGLDPASELGVKMTRGNLRARTHVTCLRRGTMRHPELGEISLADLEVVIETGRQHQIRIHLALEGTPIAGDKLYTYDDEFFANICDYPDDPDLCKRLPFARHALHAWRLSIGHPISNAPVSFEAPLPAIWDEVLFES